MNEKQQRARLAQVKTAIADKYERLARISGSRPRRERMMRHAATYRRLAADLLKQ